MSLEDLAWQYRRGQPLECSRCHAPLDPTSPEWRYAGHWQHRCPDAHPQAGHFSAIPKPPTKPSTINP
jgi:hypothetical protein